MKNMLVTDEKPAKLAQRFPAFFNKILLDAPCSGEGMFRKEEALARDWTPEKSAELSDIQKDLVLKAADMLRPGGRSGSLSSQTTPGYGTYGNAKI